MNRKHYAFFLKKNKRKNPVAKDLSDGRYHQRVIKDKTKYNREEDEQVWKRELWKWSGD